MTPFFLWTIAVVPAAVTALTAPSSSLRVNAAVFRPRRPRGVLLFLDGNGGDSSSSRRSSSSSTPYNDQDARIEDSPPTPPLRKSTRRTPPSIPLDSPDRALSIVSELKSNAALFAAFAYGGLSLPSLLTVTESKVTTVTTSLSTVRPLPGNHLVEVFVVLDTVTLCLMIACVAASQLLIYRLTDGSWYSEYDDYEDDTTNGDVTDTPQSTSAMGRLVTDYQLEFTVARTTFDLGLVALLLAVAVRAVAMFDISISGPIVTLLGGTCVLLAVAYLQSYLQVFRRLEQPKSRQINTETTNAAIWATTLVLAAVASVFYVTTAGPFTASKPTETQPQEQRPTNNVLVNNLQDILASYSSAAGDAKLKLAVDSVADEKAARKESNKVAQAATAVDSGKSTNSNNDNKSNDASGSNKKKGRVTDTIEATPIKKKSSGETVSVKDGKKPEKGDMASSDSIVRSKKKSEKVAPKSEILGETETKSLEATKEAPALVSES